MIKQLIICMRLMILCMLEIMMLIKILKEMMVFFVLTREPVKFNSLYQTSDSLKNQN